MLARTVEFWLILAFRYVCFADQGVSELQQSDHTPAQIFYRGADISSLPKQEHWAKQYRDYGSSNYSQPLEKILATNNFNIVRLRLLVNPDWDYGINETLALAKRIKATGMKLHLCLHLSDEFADPLKQRIPRAWIATTIEGIMGYLETYTKFVGDTFAENGVKPDFIAVGNEVRAGILWPYGQYPNHKGMSRLLKSAIKGVRTSKSAETKIVIHTDSQGRWDWTSEFFNGVLSYQQFEDHLHLKDFDVIGHTFYPYYAGWITFENQAGVMRNCDKAYGKEQHIVETSYPVKCAMKDLTHWPADQKSISFSPQGQLEYFNRVAKLPYLSGIIIWEPAWLTFPGQGNSCEDVLLFEPDGRGRQSLAVFKPPRRPETIERIRDPGLSCAKQ